MTDSLQVYDIIGLIFNLVLGVVVMWKNPFRKSSAQVKIYRISFSTTPCHRYMLNPVNIREVSELGKCKGP